MASKKSNFKGDTHVKSSKAWLIGIIAVAAVLIIGALASMYGNFAKGTIFVPDSTSYGDFLDEIAPPPFDPNLPDDNGAFDSPLNASLGNRALAPNMIAD